MDNYKCTVNEITYGSTYHMISNILPSTIEIPELSLLYRSCAQYVPGDIWAWYEIINILQYSLNTSNTNNNNNNNTSWSIRRNMIRSFIADSSMYNFCVSHFFVCFVLFCFVFCLFVWFVGFFNFFKTFFYSVLEI